MSREDKTLGERVAKIEADMAWLKWISMGSFASSATVAASLVAGAEPVQSAAVGVASFIGTLVIDVIRVLR